MTVKRRLAARLVENGQLVDPDRCPFCDSDVVLLGSTSQGKVLICDEDHEYVIQELD